MAVSEHPFTMAEFAAYRALTGLEPHSIVAAPGLANMDALDFRLTPGSPCIDAGRAVEALYPRPADFAGVPVPQGNAPDIGAYESPASGK